MGNAKKALLQTIILMMFTCLTAWAGDFSSGNFIPKGSSSATSSAGSIIVTYVANSSGNYDLSSDGESDIHYLLAVVGDTDVRYSSSTTASDTKKYNSSMITGIITCNAGGSLSSTFNITGAYSNGDYIIPYKCVLVKVTGFSDSHNSYSTDVSDWYGDSTNTYEVIDVIDVFSDSQVSTSITLDSHECIHVVQVPFAYSNESYFLDVEPGNGKYTTRFELTSDYTYGNTSGSATYDAWSVYGYVDQDLTSNRTTLDLGFDTNTKAMSVSELYANYSSCENKAATLDMAYNNTFTSRSNSASTENLYVTLSPYPLGSTSYLFSSDSSNDTLEMGFKVTNFQSDSSSVYLTNNSNQVLSSSSIVDTADYLNPKFKVVTEQTSKSSSGWWSRTYTYVFDGSLSFDIYPYITTESPSLSSGEYSSSIVVEFTKD